MATQDHRNTPKLADVDTVSYQPDADDGALFAQLPLISVLEAMPDAIGVYHVTGRLIFMNAAARKLFQVSDDTEYMRRPPIERVEQLQPRNMDGTPQPIERWHLTRLLNGETITNDEPAEMRVTTLKGDELHISVTGAPITTADGAILGAIAVARDVTKRPRRGRRAEARSERAMHELERLQVALNSAPLRLSLNALLHELLERADVALNADAATLLLLDERGEALTVRASRGIDDDIAAKLRVPVGRGFAGIIAKTRKPLALLDTAHADVVNTYLRENLRSVAGAPMLLDGRLIGVLTVGSRTQRDFTASDMWLLQQIADRAATAIDRAQLIEVARQAHSQTVAQARLLDAVIESLAEGVILYAPDRSALFVNSAYRRMLGVSSDQRQLDRSYAARGHAVAPRDASGALLPEEQWPATRVLRGETLDGARSQDVWLRSYDGRDAFYSATGGPVYDDQGAFMGSVLALRDITTHRQLERETAARAAELETIIETMVNGVFVHDADGTLVRVNSSGRRHLGLGEDIALALSASADAESPQRLVFTDRDGATAIPAELWPVERILRGETLTGAHAEDLLMRLPDGRERLLSVSGAPMRNAEGRLLGAVILTRDVTNLYALKRRTQDSLNALLEMAEAVVADTSSGGANASLRLLGKRIIELSRRVLGCQRVAMSLIDADSGAIRPLAVTGMTPEEERLWWAEQSADEQSETQKQPALERDLIQRLRAGESLTLDMRDPRYEFLANWYGIQSVLVSPMLIAQRLVGYISLDYDGQPHEFTADELELAATMSKLAALVIERDRMLRERAAAEAQVIALEQANHRMNEFLGIAAHELRTPITVIKANLQMLLRHVAEVSDGMNSNGGFLIEPRRAKRDAELLGRAEKSLMRLTRLVDDLLDVSRVRAGKLEMRIERIELAEVTREAVEEQRLAVPDRVITLDLPKGEPTPVSADPERIEQVITNYLTNALKYSSAKKPVRVRLQRDGAQLRVSVSDEGPGIPPEHLDQVWELFHRVPSIEVLSGSGIGLGLGLHLCKTLIERQGGRVGVTSRVGKGSTFWFSLPLLTDGEA